jgi:hypothetical protein
MHILVLIKKTLKMSTNLKLVNSPFNPPMAEAMGLIFQIHVPSGKDMVTLLVNPNTRDYQENMDQPKMQVRQYTFSEHTKDTKTITLDFGKNNIVTIDNEGTEIDVRLMNISSEKIQGQDFPIYEILVSEHQ